MTVLVVGGAGYVGSHMVRYLRDRAMACAVLDDFSTGYRDALPAGLLLTEGSLANGANVASACEPGIAAAMHFASLIQVGESVTQPGKYYANNVAATIALLNALVGERVASSKKRRKGRSRMP